MTGVQTCALPISAGGLVEPFNDEKNRLDLSDLFSQSDCYVLRVVGDSMIEDSIDEGDYAVMRSLSDSTEVKNGDIVAARVSGHGTTLKRFYQQQAEITLKPANQKYEPIKARAENVEIQGILVGVWRSVTG